MPEGLTYWDMARMLKAQIPPGFYRLELNEQFIGKEKFVGGEMLEPYLHSEFEFHFQPQEIIKTWGKAMGLSINGGLWLRLQFALHGHTVAMPGRTVVGSEMCIVFVDKNRLIQITCVALYPTVVPMPTATLLDFFTLPAFSSSSSTSIPMPTTWTWYDIALAPCPIMDVTAFINNFNLPRNKDHLKLDRKTNPIYFEIAGSKSNSLWNGIGTSHAVEILHRAWIHLEEKTSTVFKCEILQKRLVEAIKDFFAQAHSPDYQKRIPANKTPTRAFEFAKSTTQYYHSQVTKVYRKKDILIPYTLYQILWETGLLDRKICQQLPEDWKDDERTTTETGREKKKKVPEYILEFRSGVMSARHRTVQEEELEEVDDYMVTESENGSGSGSGSGNGGAGQKRKKRKNKKVGEVRIMTTEEGNKAHKFLDPEKERADIGPMPQIYNWESFHEILSEVYLVNGLPMSLVMDIMKEKYEFSPSLRGYRDRFSQWEFTKRQISLHRNIALVTKVRKLWTQNMSSANMLRCLSLRNWNHSTIQLRNLYLHLSLRLLMGTPNGDSANFEAAVRTEELVREQLISGQSIRYGQEYTLSNIRLSGVFVSQKQVCDALQKLDPEGVEASQKAFATSRQRNEYFVKGPNHVLSVDGHDKLSRFAFEVYGTIHAYSHYVVWCYVGISNRTAVSVNKQYLRLLCNTLHMPNLICSDKSNISSH
ncbi:hypothetical protein HOY82DRAFT_592900 [Tuber indicum]|nr:hypothetical protein HOY82DRAFT_592900 [Tuber indicum]